VDENARCYRDGDKVISGSPNQILDHLSVGGTRDFDRSNNVSRIAGHSRSIWKGGDC
jgi:hypothetical protein